VCCSRSGQQARLLAELLKDKAIDRVLVFSRTKHGANKVAEDLAKRHISAEAIHGNKSQSARQRALENFRAGKIRVLVATDIAARGIDIDGITHVINFDLPNVPESYVHRIGRTARAGRRRHRHLVLRQRGARLPARHREADQSSASRWSATMPSPGQGRRPRCWRRAAPGPASAARRPPGNQRRSAPAAGSRHGRIRRTRGRRSHHSPRAPAA